MTTNNKSPDHDIAYGDASEGVAAASASLAVLGRYWWNLQMQLLVATGIMRFFRAYWWLFLVAGFLLLAFVMPLGVAFVVSAFCADTPDRKAENNFIVPLRTQNVGIGYNEDENDEDEDEESTGKELLENLINEVEKRHMEYLKVADRKIDDLSDKELAATAFGAFDGTLRACPWLIELCDDEVLDYIPAIVVILLKRLGRYKEDDEDWLDEVMLESRTSEALESLRLDAECFAYELKPVQATQSDNLEVVQIASAIHHLGYLKAIERDVDDKEFAAAALGAFDGTLQAFDLKLSDLDMHTAGAAFIVSQLTSLERMGEIDPDWIAELTDEAMTSEALEAIRVEAGRFAYTMEGAMWGGPTSSA